MANVCTCGRLGIHCPVCGRRNYRGMVRRTQELNFAGIRGAKSFRCNKCIVEFIYKDGNLYDARCAAPSENQVIPETNQADDIKAVQKAIELLSGIGIKMTLEGKDILVDNTAFIPQEKKEDSLEAGWSKDSEGRVQAPITLDDLIPSSPDSNREDKDNEDKSKGDST